jgi:IS30 family transposase
MDKKNYKHITVEQRIKIEALLKAGHKASFIAEQLNVDRSSIYRELKRNKTKAGKYNAAFAQELSEEQKERFSHNRSFTFAMEKFISEKLSKERGYCKGNNIDMVSHETIYKFVYQDKENGGLLYKNLRVASKKYRKRYGAGNGKRCIIKDKISIDDRPECINDKQRVGDWEIDTIVGKDNKGAIVTIAERATAFVLIAKLNGKNAQELAEAVVKLMIPFKELVFSITSDNGTEFAMHKYISKKLGALFYFAHPYSSWERGLNEYTNRLIRQYIPKKTDIKDINHLYIREIVMKLNRRPRKNFNYNTPGKVFLNNFENNVALAS